MKKKIIAFILCACLICTTCIPAYAVGAEGIIIGGGAAAAGITLTLPQVALILAAGYGLIFAVQHADDIAAALDNALTSAAGAIENGIEKLTEWKNNAQKGEIALSSAPSFVDETIKDWVSSLYETSSVPYDLSACSLVPERTYIPKSDFWNSNSKIYFASDVTVYRAASLKTITIDDIEYYSGSSVLYAIDDTFFTDSTGKQANSIRHNNKYYYYYQSVTSVTIPKDNLAGNNLIQYEALSYLKSLCDLNALGSSDIYKFLDVYRGAISLPDTSNNSICPDVTVGGIGNVAEEHGIDNITLPDINVGQSDLLIPDVEADQSIDDVISDTLTKLKDQELEWTDYINDVAVGTPSVSIPQEDGTVSDFPITDVGVGDVPLDIPADVTNPLGPYSIDLTQYFPFCIPFDVVRFVNILCAEPEAPSFEWEFTWFDGSKDSLVIDLSPFDTVAQLLRNMEILLFIIGLALITREQIRG